MPRLHADMYDSPLRWIVNSEEDGAVVYLVDLGEMTCSCPHHTMVLGPENKLNGTMKRCKHSSLAAIRAGQYLLLREIINSHKTEGRLSDQI